MKDMGMIGMITAVVFGANAVLSGLRKAVAYYDGVPEGQDAKPDMKALNFLNKACYYSGIALDYIQGNVKH